MKNIDKLRKQLYEKVQHEFDIFIEKMKNSTPEEVLQNSYKIGICDDFLIVFEIDDRLNEKQIKALLKVDNLLSKCYEHWRENDCTHVGSIETAIKEFAEDLAKQHEPEKNRKESMSRNAKNRRRRCSSNILVCLMNGKHSIWLSKCSLLVASPLIPRLSAY